MDSICVCDPRGFAVADMPTVSISHDAAAKRQKIPPAYDEAAHLSNEYLSVDISRAGFFKNVRTMHKLASPAQLCVVVKSDAYGHGIRNLAPVAFAAGAKWFGVCSNWDAKEVRACGLDGVRVFRLRAPTPHEVEAALRDGLNIEEQVGSRAAAESLAELAQKHGCEISVHVKIDVGMGRSGFSGEDDAEDIRACTNMNGIKVVGLMSHFPKADADDLSVTIAQSDKFARVRRNLIERGIVTNSVTSHVCNTAATVRLSPERRFDLVRVGCACYGFALRNVNSLEQLLTIKTKVSGVARRTVGGKETVVATLPIGPADGFPTALSTGGHVLVGGERCPYIGFTDGSEAAVDVTEVMRKGSVQIGDEAVLVGRQGAGHVSVTEFAAWAGSLDSLCVIGITRQLLVQGNEWE